MLTHLQHRRIRCCITRPAWGSAPTDRSALAVPASHVTGLVAIDRDDAARRRRDRHDAGRSRPSRSSRLLAAERVTHTLMVPAMYKLCLLQPGFAGADLAAWRIGGYGGAPMPVATIDALAERLPGLTLLNAYGATETTSPATMMPAGRTRAPRRHRRRRAAGGRHPRDGRRRPRAAAPARPASCGSPGRWSCPATGPIRRRPPRRSPPATGIRATSARSTREGFVRIFDRKKDMLNRGGFKIYSVEVENVLMAWPGVVEAAVVGRPCPVLGERVHAFVHAPGCAADDAGAARLLRRAAGRLQGAGDAHLVRRAAAAQRQRQADEAAAARAVVLSTFTRVGMRARKRADKPAATNPGPRR